MKIPSIPDDCVLQKISAGIPQGWALALTTAYSVRLTLLHINGLLLFNHNENRELNG